jgi:hypothetical protein
MENADIFQLLLQHCRRRRRKPGLARYSNPDKLDHAGAGRGSSRPISFMQQPPETSGAVLVNKETWGRISMPALIALAVSVGLLSVVATWLFGLEPLANGKLQVWQAFIAWGCHFHSGGTFNGTRTAITCMSFGALVGMVAVLLAGQLGALGPFAAPVAVGLGAAVIVLSSKLPLLATIPASVYGFASIAGLILLGAGMTPTSSLLPTVLSIVVGAAFGYVSEMLAGALTKK